MKEEQKNKTRGRPPYEPNDQDRRLIRALISYGMTRDVVAEVVGLSIPTINKYYRTTVETAEEEANAKVAESLFDMATKGKNVAAAIFWMKARAGWSERPGGEMGKKEIQREQAKKAQDLFEPLPAPPLKMVK